MDLVYKSAFDDAQNIVSDLEKERKIVSTGFYNLDELLNGGISEGLMLISGEPGIGKSAFVNFLCDEFCEAGTPVIYFSLDMGKMQIHSRAISRQSYLWKFSGAKTKAFSAGEILGYRTLENGEKEKVKLHEYEKAMTEYFERIGKNFYVIENGRERITVEDIVRSADESKDLFEQNPVIVIDYLQLLDTEKADLDKRQRVDLIIQKLYQLSLDFHLPIIAISSVNRQSYGSDDRNIGLASFKESGNLEYTADVILAMSCDKREKFKDMRTVKVDILKNRNGSIGTLTYTYNAPYGFFVEK